MAACVPCDGGCAYGVAACVPCAWAAACGTACGAVGAAMPMIVLLPFTATGRGGAVGARSCAVMLRSMTTESSGSLDGIGTAGAWVPFGACAAFPAAARTSACVPPPASARRSPSLSVPGPVNGASSSSHDGRNIEASGRASSGESRPLAKTAGPLEPLSAGWAMIRREA